MICNESFAFGDNDPSGNQCTTIDGSSSSKISWHTEFNWAGDNWQVKSYANAALFFTPKQVAAISSIRTTMQYIYMYDGNIIANVAYDLFTSSSVDGAVEYELMVWLAALGGAWPLTNSGKSIESVTVKGVNFNLYPGMNKNVKVFTYVAT
ncbi:LOW QUALITY PROTEIN: Glycoside hydrolase [Phytophthora megakarya]|uniref:Glycoside hydrolase n=1 Tax=Phytophthora megakarya TaxID=4795 RepID=A0A225USM9_9STRA|nr:LOW QUALITY PROTEIN: Glycoside hydrolase [Phytophthora megakarya]